MREANWQSYYILLVTALMLISFGMMKIIALSYYLLTDSVGFHNIDFYVIVLLALCTYIGISRYMYHKKCGYTFILPFGFVWSNSWLYKCDHINNFPIEITIIILIYISVADNLLLFLRILIKIMKSIVICHV